MLDATTIVRLHDAANAHGHNASEPAAHPQSPLEELVLAQHQENFDLWHEEDKARDPDAPDSVIAAVKHAIDRINQRRNDLAEQIDMALLQAAPQQDGPLHSETPGMMIDRLSILSLKIFHTAEELARRDVDDAHRERNRLRLETLNTQRDDLALALDTLWSDVQAKRRRFKLYRQLKMYNDPELNPILYGHRTPDRPIG
jgi:hypothetical protein